MCMEKTSHKQKYSIAIQGTFGSFHEIAARKYFNNSALIYPCDTFYDVAQTVNEGKAEYGCYAIENTLGGSLLQNYSILRLYPLKITGEVFLRIRQNLLVLPGQTIDEITEVHSHHMAIAQCRDFFRDYPHIKLVESYDTALSAKEIAENKIRGRAAIASLLAAGMYGLEVLAEGIETNKKNYTRFLIIEASNRKNETYHPVDKSSLCFSLSHKTGSLSKVLSVIAFYDINLTKIQSMPIIGEEWRYHFYVNVTFQDFERYKQCISAITPLVKDIQIMGEYSQGVSSFDKLQHE